jgi:hypothetical protein
MKGNLVDFSFAVHRSSLCIPSDEDGAYTGKGTDESQVVEPPGLDHVIIPIYTNRLFTLKLYESSHHMFDFVRDMTPDLVFHRRDRKTNRGSVVLVQSSIEKISTNHV